jgi:2-(1,2-epoxy-1,2-dihydrophenyl)acetyl-CoA isomerase
MDDPHLLVEREPGLVVLRLNRPGRLNALSGDMLAGLEREVGAATADPRVRAILLTGAGRGFCAGGDVVGMGRPASAETTRRGMATAHGWVKALGSTDALVVTAVNGAAAGGGFGIALLGDVVLASTAAFFKAGFTSLGVAADYGLAWSLPRAVGAPRAAEILFGDRRIEAEEAGRIGLVSRIIDARTFEAEALDFARQLAAAPLSAAMTKRLLRQSDAAGFAAFLDAEGQAQAQAFQSDDFLEGVAAFKERRQPRFTGR